MTTADALQLRAVTPILISGGYLVMWGGLTVWACFESAPGFPVLLWLSTLFVALFVRSLFVRAVFAERVLVVHAWFGKREIPLSSDWSIAAVPYEGFINKFAEAPVGNLYMVRLVGSDLKIRDLASTIGSKKAVFSFVESINTRLQQDVS